MDQREILHKFLDEAQNKKSSKEEFADEFLKLKRQSTKYKADKIYPTTVAEMPTNIKKNRYKDILPYDHSRVELSLVTSGEDSNYINANFIKGVYGPKGYIATQGPLSTTVLDFWRMIWEYSVLIIVMACMEFEMGKKKCERYWTELGELQRQLGPFSISCEAENRKSDYIIRTLKAKFNSETRTIYQFHYKNWPDHDVPSSIDPILELIWDVRSYQEDDRFPICIHCSAGCGRTGVICAIDYTWMLLKDGIIPENFSVFSLIQEMRTQRPSFVQTQEQYELVYKAVLELFKRQMDVIRDQYSGTEMQAKYSVLEQNPTVETESYSPNLPESDIKEAKMMNQQSKQRLRVKSAEASSFEFRTSDISEKEGLVLHPAGQSSSFDLLELNCSCNKNADRATEWETKAFPIAGEPLQKHQSLDWSSILFGAYPNSKPADVAGRYFNSKRPIMRTKSIPFELIQQRDTKELDVKEHASCLESQPRNFCLEQPQKAMHVSSAELNYSLPSDSQHQMCNTSDAKWQDSSAVDVYSYMSSEDPYFLSLSPSSAGSKMSLDLPEKLDGNVLPCSSLPTSSTTLFSCYNSHDSLALSPPTDDPLPSQETAVVVATPPSMDDEVPPPLPERTPESFIVLEEAGEFSLGVPKSLSSPAKAKVGISREWSGTSELNTSDDSSVKLRSPKSDQHQDRSSPPPPPLPERTLESFLLADEDCMQAQSIETSSTSCPSTMENSTSSKQTLKTPGKSFTRTKSLKILRNMKKTQLYLGDRKDTKTSGICNSSPPKKPADSVQSNHSSSFLNFGFANRFSKPKGPRKPPSTWNI
ncbi:tyrosine-protein phosphatase non-receptor type 22 isoform X2 [Canis lupus baileyi]|uniref:tyrosine-protein phosphatase non-receptor type 22 isoform X2 n=1 Tax=Canis lupus familiaris TaxID=9615 RepID=UPI0006B3C9CE|nr:tyrosine-protein phosphatase non-receptor type 22 isoform X2 [Canis lupus familiaris]XP_038417735.1 tyrosine-protein phosphatase non-receptor type 22 isoform X2 [Canis lupus familiaris]XP_038547741.1 tyrosine-protein phosphatase non-receptor type 22 isoform X2 [Canis lupus familiaris]|eukprot:XP_005630680.2 tyrosine-protein phosphatase non-receptor type 22 isoform X2 [Canis lupus familiaris]